MKKLSITSQILRHVVLMTGAVVILIPFVWMLTTSFKPPEEIFTTDVRFIPHKWHIIQNYTAAFTKVPLLRYMINGIIVTSCIFILQVIFAVPCAYALAKLRFKGKNFLFITVLFCLLIPPQAISIPLYLLLWKLKVLNTYGSLIIPWIISVFGIFLMRQFFKTVPDDLMYAARIDGMSEIGIIIKVMVPMAVPAITAFGIFSLIAHWNDYFWPLVVLNNRDLATPPLGIAYFRNEEAGMDYGPLMAAASAIIAPLIVAFLAAQQKFIKGISMQAGIK